MKRYTATISIHITERDLGNKAFFPERPESTKEVREALGGLLFEIIQDMVLGRLPYDFDFGARDRTAGVANPKTYKQVSK